MKRPIIGTMRLGAWGAKLSPPELVSFLWKCVELGACEIDLADVYGDYTTNKLVGAALTHDPTLGNELRLIVKIGVARNCAARPSGYPRLRFPNSPTVSVATQSPKRAAQSGAGPPSASVSSPRSPASSCAAHIADNASLITSDSKCGRVVLERVAGPIARQHGASLAQIYLSWIYRLPGSTRPVLGSSRIEKVKEAVDAAAIQLGQEQWYELLEAADGRLVA